MLYRTLSALALLGCAAAPPALADEAAVHASYVGYARGFNLLSLDTVLAIHTADYRLQVSYRLAGAVGVFVHGDANTVVDGRFVSGHAEPRQFFSVGHLRGNLQVTQIDWQSGSPKVVQLVPPAEAERDPILASDQAHTIDALSGMAVLMRQATYAGRCDGAMRTFDGRRLAEISAHTVGEETLDETSRSSFHGPALRCDFQWRQLAGFLHDDDQAALLRPLQGSAWLARLQPGQPLIPVRIAITARFLGDTTLYLTQAPASKP